MPKAKKIIDTGLLNIDQRDAFEELRTFISSKTDNSVYVLKGWAGTGKTFCISFLINHVLNIMYPTNQKYKISVTGPTNKSVRVIKKTSGINSPRVTFQTIHKLLGLKERITMDGRQEFVNDGESRPQISAVKLLVIDEVSMLNDELFNQIVKYRGRMKIICMGDPAQIPPVGKPDCIPFRDELAEAYCIKTISLRKVMRQKEGNSIIDKSVRIRENLGGSHRIMDSETQLNNKGEGVEFLNLNLESVRSGFSDNLAKYFRTESFQNDPEFSKVIAWRNKTVNHMNSVIRKTIYGEESIGHKILVGEKLIANGPIIQQGQIVLNTNDEFTVESFEVKRENISVEFNVGKRIVPIEYYNAEISYLDDKDEECYLTIEILHENSEGDFDSIAKSLKNRAIESQGKNRTWITYYNFLRRYADVSYSYAITAHKSQGSTYNTAFVLEDDIDANINLVERDRIKYTAFTRASKKLYVLKRF
jgi:exodeoxyribonuclease V